MWYNLSEQERVSQVFSKYTIQDFWNWWNGESMELRFPDRGTFFAKSSEELEKYINKANRENLRCWYGVNPKINGGAIEHVKVVNHLFIDVDRKVKMAVATNVELEDCDITANKILERLGENGFANNYVKVCSGNGVQLLVKLDYPIKEDDLFKAFYKNMLVFVKKLRTNSELDGVCSDISRVAALPFTKNYKPFGTTQRGIIEIKQDGGNIGFTEYLLNCKVLLKKRVVPVDCKKVSVFGDYRLILGELEKNMIIRQFLVNDFPNGGINNTYWWQLKVLFKINNIDVTSDEVLEIHKKLRKKHNRPFPFNMPDSMTVADFDYKIIKNCCKKNKVQCYEPKYWNG